MKKTMVAMLLCLLVLFGGVFFYKYLKGRAEEAYAKAHRVVYSTVSAMKASEKKWIPHLEITGSLRTVKGVNVTAELGGMIREIYLQPGSYVKKGKLLVQLDIDPDVAKLHELQANAAIAEITYNRNKKQYKIGAISQETLDRNKADFEATQALVAEQKAVIAKKTIRAPFEGRLGISAVNPGQFINPGDKVITLETIDPIYADFYVPQQELPYLSVKQSASVKVDTYPKKTYTGKITTINPIVDKSIRNVKVEATLPNAQHELLPGMFVTVTVTTGVPIQRVTLPHAAITFNPYGSIVYMLTPLDKTHNGKKVWEAMQKFVTTGETRGNQVAILKGIKKGEMVVTSGQLKLKNKSYVVIDNKLAPSFDPDPHLPNN